MKLGLRPYCLLLALLLLGSASIQAQSSDPFPNVNFRRYQGNMTITAKVVRYGLPVTDAVVAVYCDETIRGKENVGSGTNPNLAYLTVYGNKTGAKQELYFKIYTSGSTLTYNPSTAITFKNNRSVGSNSEPYIIDVTPEGSVISLVDNADNTETLTTLNGKTCNVALTGRTLYRDGNWNTLCLPFNTTLTGILAGATLMELDTTNDYNGMKTGFDASTSTLYLFFKVVDAIEAGKPYFIKWETTDTPLENPIFCDVTITSTVAGTVAATNSGLNRVEFKGVYGPVPLDENDKSNLFLGNANTLFYPNVDNYSINAFRGYFHVDLTGASYVREFVLNFGGGTTAIDAKTISTPEWERGDEWYDLTGRHLADRPTARGIYVNNGHKIVVK